MSVARPASGDTMAEAVEEEDAHHLPAQLLCTVHLTGPEFLEESRH